MRVLVVAEDPLRREVLALRAVSAAGHEVGGLSDVREASLAVLRAEPKALLVELAEGSAAQLVRLLERARNAAEAPLPAVVLLPEGSVWLRGSLPSGLMPAAAIEADHRRHAEIENAIAASPSGGDGIERVLRELAGGGAEAGREALCSGELRLDAVRRELTGPAGTAHLTESETRVLAAVVEGGGGVVTAEQVAGALWGRPLTASSTAGPRFAHTSTPCGGSSAPWGSTASSSRCPGSATGCRRRTGASKGGG